MAIRILSKLCFVFILLTFHSNLFSQSNQWTWVGGLSSSPNAPVYGVKGQASKHNTPGGRRGSVSWTDNQGHFWMFGGYGLADNGFDYLNDLWRFDPVERTWTWVSGSDSTNVPGIYGLPKQASKTNHPGARYGSISWTDNEGGLWLFGGYGYSTIGTLFLNDLWRYNPNAGTWTWMSGSNFIEEVPIYGDQRQASINNTPGGRTESVGWTDDEGILWMFGGKGISSGGSGKLNDLWRYDPYAGTWTWVSGSNKSNAEGVYGIQGQESTSNIPGARDNSVSWKDSHGIFWMFGGDKGNTGRFNDLWCFDPEKKTWTWVKGSDSINAPGIYGAQGQASMSNSPGARTGSINWFDNRGNLWLFGGFGISFNSKDLGYLNDLWCFNLEEKSWTWVGGNNTTAVEGFYGTRGQPSTGNKPGARTSAISWIDSRGELWLFGGNGYGKIKTSTGDLNDLWHFNPTVGTWTWESGSSSLEIRGIYGIKGEPSSNNSPGARTQSMNWTDNQGRLWMFGGQGYSSNSDGFLNDLWRFNPDEKIWTWASGNDSTSSLGIYGSEGHASTSTSPGARIGSITWTDNDGGLWLFGGEGYSSSSYGKLNDLWLYDPDLGTWTWVSGSSTTNTYGVYGTQGMASASNYPGARYGSISWTDSQGRLWMFGGYGYSSNSYGNLNDLWRYDPGLETWTWVSGSNSISSSGIYGTKGQSSTKNSPGARSGSISWTDIHGNFWMFGGYGYSSGDWYSSASYGYLNDLWRYDPILGKWTWVSGSNSTNAAGLYDNQGQTFVSIGPGARAHSISWSDNQGRLWMLGGYGFSGVSGNFFGHLNDFWRFDPSDSKWTWVSGSSSPSTNGIYGTKGQASADNSPGARSESISWTDNQNRFWIFGGNGYSQGGYITHINDLWRYDPELPLVASIAVTAPANNSIFTEGSTISIIALAVNPFGSIRYVDFFEQGNKLGTDSIKPYTLTRTNVPAETYRVSAMAITNLGDTLRSDTITLNVTACSSVGTIYGEGYRNILDFYPSFPNNPYITGQLTAFEYKNIGDNYGGRLRGYLCVPQTGFYTFYIATDDQAGLWLSTDENPANKQLIAYTTLYTDFRQWNKFNTQQSQPVYLIAGARYYVETLHKEAVGQDHLSIAWKLPDGKFEGPIPGSRLSPFTESGATNPSRATMNFEDAMRLELNEKLQVKAIPNPSNSHFTIDVEGMTGTPVQLTVTDVLGRRVEHRTNLQANTILQLGQQWKPGIYILQLQQGKDYKTIKLIKE